MRAPAETFLHRVVLPSAQGSLESRNAFERPALGAGAGAGAAGAGVTSALTGSGADAGRALDMRCFTGAAGTAATAALDGSTTRLALAVFTTSEPCRATTARGSRSTRSAAPAAGTAIAKAFGASAQTRNAAAIASAASMALLARDDAATARGADDCR